MEDHMITLIFCGDLKYCPYIKRYTERLDLNNTEYEVLFWNRSGMNLDLPSNYYYYDYESYEGLGKFRKLFDFWKFRNWVKNHLKISKPNKLIFLSTLSGMILYDIIDNFHKRYIFDIRDYSYEHLKIFIHFEEKIIRNSYFTAISSKGFENFLPKHEYVIAHNFNRNEINETFCAKKLTSPISVVWNGTVRFFEYQRKYIDALKNDKRFFMVYHGTGTDLERYKAYCEKNNVNNIVFTGEYDNSNKAILLENASILNNCYGGKNGDELKHAISNRFYDGLIFKIPQIVEKGSYKEKLVNEHKIGIAIDFDDNFADVLYDYYSTLDFNCFNFNTEKLLNRIKDEDNDYILEIDNFIKND